MPSIRGTRPTGPIHLFPVARPDSPDPPVDSPPLTADGYTVLPMCNGRVHCGFASCVAWPGVDGTGFGLEEHLDECHPGLARARFQLATVKCQAPLSSMLPGPCVSTRLTCIYVLMMLPSCSDLKNRKSCTLVSMVTPSQEPSVSPASDV